MTEHQSLHGQTILIVEDEPLIALDISMAFQRVGAKTRTTQTFEQALPLLDKESIAAVIVDHGLHLQGLAITVRLKELGIPYVVFSGVTKIADLPDGVPHVVKPADPAVLVTVVSDLLASVPRPQFELTAR